MASLTPLRYPMPYPTTQAATAQPDTKSQIERLLLPTPLRRAKGGERDHQFGTQGPHHQSPRQSRQRA
jgi:hypothetical protein